MSSLKVVLVSTGDEITNGDIVDSNGAWLAEQLFLSGIATWAHESIPDDEERLLEIIERLSHTVDIAVFCGGLGPTEDDYTVDAVARWLGTQAEHHQPTLEKGRQYFASRGIPFVVSSERQCRVPQGTDVYMNPVGMAPAFSVQSDRCRLFFLPGPPREFQGCCEISVLPYARNLARSRGEPATAFRRFRTTGLGESMLADLVKPIVDAHPDARFGWRAAYPEVWFKVLVSDQESQTALLRLEEISRQTEAALGQQHLFGTGEETLEAVTGALLKQQGLTLATAESCTGGMLGSVLTSVPGSSGWYVGGVVTYSNHLKTQLLGVSETILATHGAVSEACARAMAEGARSTMGTDLAIAITGIAGPDGGTPQKPVGTVYIALATPQGTFVHLPRLRPPREIVRKGATHYALNMVRRYLLGILPTA